MLSTDQIGTLSAIVRETLASGEEVRFTAATDSMRPMIAPGDTVLVKGTRERDMNRGDIVLYKEGPHLCIHRLLYKELIGEKTILITKGDSSLQMDSPLLMKQFLGKVVAVEKGRCKINLQHLFWQILSKIIAIFSLIEAISIKTVKGAINAFN